MHARNSRLFQNQNEVMFSDPYIQNKSHKHKGVIHWMSQLLLSKNILQGKFRTEEKDGDLVTRDTSDGDGITKHGITE